jgi:REP element-mobilizing transposase RayT
MARPVRIEYEGAFYHVTARGNERKKIFVSKADYEKFLANLKDASERFSVVIHSYALMGNHYHLLVETPNANLSSFMHAVQSGYTVYFNKKRNRAGHLFQGRFKSILVDKEAYLLELSRYIHLNPVRAHITDAAESYPFSSYVAFIDPHRETFVFRDLILGMSHGPDGYRRFVESAETERLTGQVYGGMILGRKSFIKEALQRLKNTERKEISHRRAIRAAADLDDVAALIAARFRLSTETVRASLPYRTYAIYLVKKHTAFSNPEIGAYFGNISFSAVTKTVSRLNARMEEDRTMKKEMALLEKKLLSSVKG